MAAGAAALGFLAADLIALAPRADAAHHLVRIRQVFPGTTMTPTAEFAVLQLTAAGENLFFMGPLGTATVSFFDVVGQQNSGMFTMDPPNGENQRTVLIATGDAEVAFGVQADLQLGDDEALTNANGAVCLDSTGGGGIDCVEWGAMGAGGTQTSPTGTFEPAIPADNMLQRSIGLGCPTLHEFGDDSDDSAADFSPVPIATGSFIPRNNAAAIVETSCTPPTGTTPPGNPASPINPAGNVRKRKCKKKPKGAAAAKKKRCKRKRK